MSKSKADFLCPFILAVFAAAFPGCGLVDLGEIRLSTTPAKSGAVLESAESGLVLRFSEPVEASDAEAALEVRSESGSVAGEFLWAGTLLTFRPLEPWEAGVRYELLFSGSVRARSGRETSFDLDISFRIPGSTVSPSLLSFLPADGASVTADGALSLTFSEAMDRRSVEEGLSINPDLSLEWTWSDDGRTARAQPEQRLAPCAAWRWRLSTDARSLSGVRLNREETGCFAADLDLTPPEVESTGTALFSNGAWISLGTGLDGLRSGEGILIRFSEVMDSASLADAVSLEPSVSGRLELLDARTAVFVPGAFPADEGMLSLCITSRAADANGLSLPAYRETFSPDTEGLSVVSVLSGEAGLESPLPSRPTLKTVVSAVDSRVALYLCFSSPVSQHSRIATVALVRLGSFFPETLASPRLIRVSWPSPDCLSLTWEGLTAGSDAGPHWYQLTLAGGASGVVGEDGRTMAGDFEVYLEAAP